MDLFELQHDILVNVQIINGHVLVENVFFLYVHAWLNKTTGKYNRIK